MPSRPYHAEETMPIWKLMPVNLRDPNWQASSHRWLAIVRTRNEADAHAFAAKAFDAKSQFGPGKGRRFPPWKRPALVKAERIEDKRCDSDGPPSVLEPSV